MSQTSRSNKADSKQSCKTLFTRSLNARSEQLHMNSSINRFSKRSSQKKSKKSSGRTTAETQPPIQRILHCSLERWLSDRHQERRRKAELLRLQRHRSESLKRMNHRIRQYNKRHFKSEAIEQPPWGIDQERLKRYAERVIEMTKRVGVDTPDASTLPYAPFRSINNEYFAGKSRSSRKQPLTQTQRRKSKSKLRAKRDYYD